MISTGSTNLFRVNSAAPSVFGLGAYTAAGGSADVAEMFEVASGELEVGEVAVSVGGKKVRRAEPGDAPERVIGIVSSNPGVRLGWDAVEKNEMPDHRALALTGRVHVKVTGENGPVRLGDPLTLSASRPGYAMKATRPGPVIGTALEAFAGGGEGSVLCFVNPHTWVDFRDYEALKARVEELERLLRSR